MQCPILGRLPQAEHEQAPLALNRYLAKGRRVRTATERRGYKASGFEPRVIRNWKRLGHYDFAPKAFGATTGQ
jgi:hypothetical protein